MGFHYLRKGIALFSLLLMSFSLFASVMTPYVEKVDPEEFYNGATFDIGPGNFNNEEFSKELEKANSLYNINTITIYGFEGLSQSSQQYIFSELSRLGMKIVIRIESYPQDFSFSEADAKAVVSSYSALIDFCSDENRRDTVAYFALNMPVDDIAVQRNAGGLNTRAWIDAQKSYASAFVRLMREECARNGWDDAKMYLSVFYGWDNTFKTPSYKDAGADGYFINNYTYPDSISLSSSDPLEIINAKRLAVSMKTYEKQYGDAPVVMEWGFHTIDFNGGIQPNQTAGLVKNLYAKEIAMKATLDFYKENYPQVRGCLYFGYNLLKEEGNPPALLDWCLVYPLMEGWNDAVNALASEGVIFSEDGWVFLSDEGSSLEFDNCPELQMISVYYRSDVDSTVKIYSDGRSRGIFSIPASKEDAIIGIPLIGSEDASLKMELQDLQSRIDSLTAKLDRMYTDRLNGLLPEADFQRIFSRIKGEREQLEEKRKALAFQQKSPVPSEDRARELVQRFIETAGESRELLVSLIERVELTEDKEVIIKFRFAQLDGPAESQTPQGVAPSGAGQISGTFHLQ